MAEQHASKLNNNSLNFYNRMRILQKMQSKIYAGEDSIDKITKRLTALTAKANEGLSKHKMFDGSYVIEEEDLAQSSIAYYCEELLIQDSIQIVEYDDPDEELYLPVIYSGLEVITERIDDFKGHGLTLEWPRIVHMLAADSDDIVRPLEKDQGMQILAVPIEESHIIKDE